MKDDNLFAKFKMDFIKKAKERDVKLLGVKDRVLTLEVDEIHVRVERCLKGGFKLLCACDACGAQAEANNALCSRKLATINYMFKHIGDFSEIELDIYKKRNI